MKGKTRARRRQVGDDYLSLVKRFPLRPIRDSDEYDLAAEMLDALITRSDLTTGETEYMEALTRFVEDFDYRHYDLTRDGRSPFQRLRSLMRTAGLSASELGDLIGSRPAASMILNGRRELSKSQIRVLAEHFKTRAFLRLRW